MAPPRYAPYTPAPRRSRNAKPHPLADSGDAKPQSAVLAAPRSCVLEQGSAIEGWYKLPLAVRSELLNIGGVGSLLTLQALDIDAFEHTVNCLLIAVGLSVPCAQSPST